MGKKSKKKSTTATASSTPSSQSTTTQQQSSSSTTTTNKNNDNINGIERDSVYLNGVVNKLSGSMSGIQLSESDRQALVQTLDKLKSFDYTRIYVMSTIQPRPAICALRMGNDEYYKEKNKAAIEFYNSAIVLSGSNPLLIVTVLLNRAISKLRIQEYKKSILDCTLALSIQPNCIKAYICRAYGYFFTKEFKKAFSDHFIAQHLTPTNITLSQAMRLSSSMLWALSSSSSSQQQQKSSSTKGSKKNNEPIHPSIPHPPIFNSGPYEFNKSVQLDWLSDFNSLSIEEEPCRMHLLVNYTNNMERTSRRLNKIEIINKEIGFLIPSGDTLYNTSWSEFEEYHSQSKSNMSESLSSKQKILGNSDFQSKNYLSALGHYTKAIKLNPICDPVYYSNRGIAYLKLNRFLEAITDCSISIALQPSMRAIKAYLRRGAGYAAIGDYSSAVRDYRAALKFEPESLEVLMGLSKILRIFEAETKNKLLSNPTDQNLQNSLKSISNEINTLNSKINSNNNINSASNQSTSNNSTKKSSTTTTVPPNPTSTSAPSTPPPSSSSTASPPTSTTPPTTNGNKSPTTTPTPNSNTPTTPTTPTTPPPSSSSTSPPTTTPTKTTPVSTTPTTSTPPQQPSTPITKVSPQPNTSTTTPTTQPTPTPTPTISKQPTSKPSLVIPTVPETIKSHFQPSTRQQIEHHLQLENYFTQLIQKRVGSLSLLYLGRAEVLVQLGDFKAAIDDYKRALEQDPKSEDILKRYNTAILHVRSLKK